MSADGIDVSEGIDVEGPGSSRTTGLRTHRMEAFSDGVFAIAITLLVLELAVPLGSQDHLVESVAAQWPSYLAYVVSFSSIGAAWVVHTTISEYLDHVDSIFLRINLLVLLVVSFLPFPTRLLAENLSSTGAERVAVTFYGLNLFLASALLAVMWRYSVAKRLVRSDSPGDDIRLLTRRLTPGLAVYVVIIGVGLLWPIAAVIGYLVIALFFLVPLRSSRRDAA